MRNRRILIVTEANMRVASGHLHECMECLRSLQREDCTVHLMINSDMPVQFKALLDVPFYEYESDIQTEAQRLVQLVSEQNYDIVLFNLREIHNHFLKEIKSQLHHTIIVCVDEFGRRALEADVIINPMIDEYYWEYETGAKLYCGAKYLVLPDKLKQYHSMEKQMQEQIQQVTVSMGGVDAPGTTLKLAEWLPRMLEGIKLHLVLGGGFAYEEELREIVGAAGNVTIHRNISYLYDLFYESDLAICAGGNTLHELAAIGTPTITIPSMPHEKRNATSFEQKGFGIGCGSAEEITEAAFSEALKILKDVNVRREMSVRGKAIADGRGNERICEIVLNV